MVTEHIRIVVRTIDMKNIFIFLTGVFIGLFVNALITKPDNNYYENYMLSLATKESIQKNFMEFYITDYCAESQIKELYANVFGTTFEAIYCNKPSIMLLDDSLPIDVIKMREN